MLDVQRTTLDPQEEQENLSEAFVIVLAVPLNYQAKIIAATAGHRLAITLLP